MMRKSKNGVAGTIITIIILIIIVIFSNSNIKTLSSLEGTLGKMVMPIQNGLVYLKNKVAKNNTFFADINNIKTENEELKNRNSELEKQLREMEIIKAENSTLKQYVNLSEKYTNYTTTPATVIDKDISNYMRNIIINVGDEDGIKPKMVVISDEGLVGFVVSTTKNTSKVQTIFDPASSVSATITTSRDSVICKGDLNLENEIRMTYIPTDASIVVGDNIETSGMGGIFPKGINIGKIEKLNNTKNITDRNAIVKSAVNFKKLEAVLVITQ